MSAALRSRQQSRARDIVNRQRATATGGITGLMRGYSGAERTMAMQIGQMQTIVLLRRLRRGAAARAAAEAAAAAARAASLEAESESPLSSQEQVIWASASSSTEAPESIPSSEDSDLALFFAPLEEMEDWPHIPNLPLEYMIAIGHLQSL